jgi:hypothetical protein
MSRIKTAAGYEYHQYDPEKEVIPEHGWDRKR